ncbi:hypothetical protein RQP46_007439 [Phenoliferia psychrophenolica]
MLGLIGLVLAMTGLALAAQDAQNPCNCLLRSLDRQVSATLVTRTGSPSNGNQRLADGEASYLKTRRDSIVKPLWDTYLLDTSTGTTVSGGGYRAALYGAGTLSAFDGRNTSHIAPLLQLADYISGLSGGSWVVSSLMQNNLPTLYDLVLGGGGQEGWNINYGLLSPSSILESTYKFGGDTDYRDDLCHDVKEKSTQGSPVSYIDVWGRALSYHLFKGTTKDNFYENDTPASHASGLLWSDLKSTSNFSEFKSPVPIVVTTSRANDSDTPTLRNTQFEFTPYTFGSYDPSLMATVPVEFAGTHANNGVPSNGCLTDGGENDENIPLSPLLVKARAQDLILALDASADTGGDTFAGYPDGTSLITTAKRIATYFKGFTSFPPIPSSTDDFTDDSSGLSLTQRPTFFGCNTRGNGSMASPDSYPIIVYLPCALVDRARKRAGMVRSQACKVQFEKCKSRLL